MTILKAYEYIRITLDFGDLSELNRLGLVGFHVVSVTADEQANWVLLEREYGTTQEAINAVKQNPPTAREPGASERK